MRAGLLVPAQVEVVDVGQLEPGIERLLARRIALYVSLVLFSRKFVIAGIPCVRSLLKRVLCAALARNGKRKQQGDKEKEMGKGKEGSAFPPFPFSPFPLFPFLHC